MMRKRYYYDLHVHTALSPCADNHMTPNNIINMAVLKGLDYIAITDHNSALNVKAVVDCALDKNIVVVPGMEVETAEEVHLTCLFRDVESAVEYGDVIYSSLPSIKNNERIFGEQLVIDSKDRTICRVEKLLLNACSYTIEEVLADVTKRGGVVIPSHIDRESYSIISNLGGIPNEIKVRTIELTGNCIDGFLSRYPQLKRYNSVISSDAHSLGSILERTSGFNAEEKSIGSLFRFLEAAEESGQE